MLRGHLEIIINTKIVLPMCGMNKSELFHKHFCIRFLKVGRFDEPVIRVGREFQVLGPTDKELWTV